MPRPGGLRLLLPLLFVRADESPSTRRGIVVNRQHEKEEYIRATQMNKPASHHILSSSAAPAFFLFRETDGKGLKITCLTFVHRRSVTSEYFSNNNKL